MSAVARHVHVPLSLRLTGTPSERDWERLEAALTQRYARAFRLAAAPRPGAPAAALAPARGEGSHGEDAYGARSGGRVAIPAYDDEGAPAQLPLARNEPPTTAQAARDFIAATLGLSGDPTVKRGVYAALGGDLRVWWWDAAAQRLRPLWIYTEHGDQRTTVALSPGTYTLIARPRGDAMLYRGGRLVTRVRNRDDLDISATFVVPDEPGEDEVVVHARSPWRWHPRLRVLRIDGEQQVATGAQSVFLADVEIWGVDDRGAPYPVFGLALIYAFLTYEWEIWSLGRAPSEGAPRPRRLALKTTTRTAFLRHVWHDQGDYEVTCTVTLRHEGASPLPVSDTVRVDVVPLEFKMAVQLAALTQGEQAPGGRTIWSPSTLAVYDQLYQALRAERAAAQPNAARIEYLEQQLAKLTRQVDSAREGPFAIRAIFTEPRTGKTMPLRLFVGPAREPVEGRAHTWVLVDLTYPTFYATYTGSGETVREAIIAAFEDARTRFKSSYPVGRILARIEFRGMERFGLAAGWDFSIETESWQRSAFEWLSLGASALGAVALAAAIVFPPSAVVTGVVVIGAAAGATVSAISIAERIHTNQFEWNTETFVDIAQIASAFAFGAGAVARGAAGRIVGRIPRGQSISLDAASKLGKLVSFQRGLLYMGLGTDAASGVLLSVDAYQQLRDVDVALGDETRRDYERIYGAEEGRRRWEVERVTRIMGILARAAVGSALTIVSVRASVAQLRTPGAGLVAPGTAQSAEEAALLRQTEGRGRTTIVPSEVEAELELVQRRPKRLIAGEYVEEVQLENGHTWRRRSDGTWCRFSTDPFCVRPQASRSATAGSLPRLAEAAGAREQIEEGRIAVFLHGTTDAAALRLVDDPRAYLSPTGGAHGGKFFTATNWAVIDEFAARSASKVPGSQAAIVGIALEESTLTQLKALKVRGSDGRLVSAVEIRPIGDRPGLYETIFHPAALSRLVEDGLFFLVVR